MSAAERLRTPTELGPSELCEYVASPRPKPFFRTVIDPYEVFLAKGRSTVRTSLTKGAAPRLDLHVEHRLKRGSLVEICALSAGPTLQTLSLTRTADDADGLRARTETTNFESGPVRMPDTAYPEVLLPFLMRGQPFDGQRRSIHAWINDRFVAKVYYQMQRRGHVLEVPAGRFSTHEVLMYPDLNDWIPMGAMLTTLAKPLLPKYHMWFDDKAPHRVVRFEGPYGPPGAPEVVLELASFQEG